MKTAAFLRFAACVFGCAALNASADPRTIRIRPGENWWGLCNAFGFEMPITEKSRFDWDFTANNYGNQAQSVLVSDRGRVVCSREPLRVVCSNGTMTCVAEGGADITVRDDCATDLRGAYRWASKNFFPPAGEEPELLYFAAPQYNTWIELTYHQNEKDVLAYAQSMLDHGLPPGILMIDDTWQLDYGTWEFDPRRFPDPKGMVAKLHKMGFKVLLWTCPWVSMDSPEYRRIQLALDPDDVKGWPTRGGFLTTAPATKANPYPPAAPVKWWNGYSALLDFTHPNAVAWYTEQLDRLQRDYGIDAFKFDGGSIGYYVGAGAPKAAIDAVDVRGAGTLYAADRTASATRQSYLYGSFALKYRGSEYRCGFGFGGQPVVMRLHDKAHAWRDVSVLVPAMLNSGIIGIPFICPDMVGGGQYSSFLPGAPFSQELFIRSAEVQALCPMMQISASPWRVLDARHQKIFRDVVALRQKFAPTFVRLARQAARDGEPIMRYLEYAYPHRGYAAITDEFLMGEDLLVAPVVEKGATSRTVVLPPGTWRDADGKTFTGPATLTVAAPLEKLPYFERVR